jgi:hypothetical protein
MGRIRRPRKRVKTEDDVTPRLASLRLEHQARISGNGLTRIDGVLRLLHTPEPLLTMYVNSLIQIHTALTKALVLSKIPHGRRYYAYPQSSETRYGNMRSATKASY